MALAAIPMLIPIAAAIYVGVAGDLGGTYLVIGAVAYAGLLAGSMLWVWRHPQPAPPLQSNDDAWWGNPVDPDDKRWASRGS